MPEQEKYLTFKGIYDSRSDTYYLCDFYRHADGDGSPVLRVEAEANKGGVKLSAHLHHDTATRRWRILERGIEDGLASKLLETAAGLVG